MKKRLIRRLLPLLLTALLVIAMSPAALAGPIEKTYTVRLADGIDEEIHSPDGSWIDDVVLVSGELPYGVVIGHKEDYMYIIGVPAFAGTYEARVDMEIGGGAYQYLIRIIVQDPNAPVKITKHPTGEIVTEGESAVFISRADNATEIIWRLVSPDSAVTYNCKDAAVYFPGLEVIGLGTDTLVLKNIPLSLNGWKVEAKFMGQGGPVFSNGAVITVNRAVLKEPVISVHPQGIELETGKFTTLTVGASAAEGSLCYQWYRADSPSGDGYSIPGANGASLNVDETLGSGYYFVGVWSVEGERASPMVLSTMAYVLFKEPAAPAVTPEQPAQPSAEPSVTAQPETPTQPGQTTAPAKNNSNLLLILGAVGCAAALGVCVIMIIKRARQR